jgi:hypothetical protein
MKCSPSSPKSHFSNFLPGGSKARFHAVNRGRDSRLTITNASVRGAVSACLVSSCGSGRSRSRAGVTDYSIWHGGRLG